LSGESRFTIAALRSFAEFDRCVEIQDEIWNYEPSARMSQKTFLLASQIGGQALGAFDGATMVGYAMSLPGVRGGQAYLHSHHLAVLPAWRNLGLGRRLKLAQRDDALQRGIELIEWTFDPVEIKNSYLNIAKLGALSRRYKADFYGPSSSPLQGGLPTDRLVAEWWLRSERVERALRGEAPEVNVVKEIDVPGAVYEWKASTEHRDEARAVQARNAAELMDAFKGGLAVLGYRRCAGDDGSFLLGKWNEKFEIQDRN
jgi:predicted GNAT superfamily acetyltransferase